MDINIEEKAKKMVRNWFDDSFSISLIEGLRRKIGLIPKIGINTLAL